MKTIMAFFCMIITVVIVVVAFGCGYQLGADNTEQKYSDDASSGHVFEDVASKICDNATEVDKLRSEVDVLNTRIQEYKSENYKLGKLLQQERQKGVIDKMSDNLAAAADGAVELWDNITD